jgi:hypothetical protein
MDFKLIVVSFREVGVAIGIPHGIVDPAPSLGSSGIGAHRPDVSSGSTMGKFPDEYPP